MSTATAITDRLGNTIENGDEVRWLGVDRPAKKAVIEGDGFIRVRLEQGVYSKMTPESFRSSNWVKVQPRPSN